MSRLEVVAEKTVDDAEVGKRVFQSSLADQARAAQMQQAATSMLLTAIKALGQRFVVALATLFTLLTVGSAFYLWMVALPNISMAQIVACSIYSAFILALNWRKQS